MKLNKKEKQWILNSRKRKKVVYESRRTTVARKRSSMSKGEKKVHDFLISENVEFFREYYFTSCYSPISNRLLYFDFWIPEYNLVIEYDGEYHYSKDKTENQKVNDFTKNAYCAKNHINLLRIKYTDFDNIEPLICQKVDKITLR